MNFQLKQLTPSQISQEEEIFWGSLTDPGVTLDTWKSMYAVFKNIGPEQDWQYYHTYWRWFSELTSQNIHFLNQEQFVNLYISRQIPVLLQLGYSPLQMLYVYFSQNTFDGIDMPPLYTRVKNAFINSPAIIGKDGENYVRIKDIFAEYSLLLQRGDNAIERANFKSRILGIFKKNEKIVDLPIFDPDTEKVMIYFLNLMNFFIGVKEDGIFPLVYAYFNPDEFEETGVKKDEEVEKSVEEYTKTSVVQPVPEEKPRVEEKKVEFAKVPTVLPKQEITPEPPKDDLFYRAPVEEKPVEVTPETPRKKLDPKVIQKMIESRFNKNENGEFMNVEGVLTLLDSLANEYGDDSLRELYHFDEEQGKFVWNNALLQ
ncbi:MAG: hypothetical protein V1848_03150 [Candidatus Magasanikbacteria bacterium]